MAISQTLNINGKAVSFSIDDPDMPLLYALRDYLGLRGARFGCGLGQCGACTVHVDGHRRKGARDGISGNGSGRYPCRRTFPPDGRRR
jgi:nicotinate dehydrogenase subunit A